MMINPVRFNRNLSRNPEVFRGTLENTVVNVNVDNVDICYFVAGTRYSLSIAKLFSEHSLSYLDSRDVCLPKKNWNFWALSFPSQFRSLWRKHFLALLTAVSSSIIVGILSPDPVRIYTDRLKLL